MRLTCFWSFKHLRVKVLKIGVFTLIFLKIYTSIQITIGILESLKYNFHNLNIIAFN